MTDHVITGQTVHCQVSKGGGGTTVKIWDKLHGQVALNNTVGIWERLANATNYISMKRYLARMQDALGKSSWEKNGNSLVFYQRGGTPPPLAGLVHFRFFPFPFFSIFFYRCEMIFTVWNTTCMIWDFIGYDLWRQYIYTNRKIPKEVSLKSLTILANEDIKGGGS